MLTCALCSSRCSVKIDVDAVLAEHELLTEIERQKADRAAQALLPKPSLVPKPSPAVKAMPSSANSKPNPITVPKKRKLAANGSLDGGSPSAASSPSATPKTTTKKTKLQTARPPPPPPAPPPVPVFVPPPSPPVEKAMVPPCVLCPSFDQSDLMAVVSVPVTISLDNKDPSKVWYAHERCAENIPEVNYGHAFVCSSTQTESFARFRRPTSSM